MKLNIKAIACVLLSIFLSAYAVVPTFAELPASQSSSNTVDSSPPSNSGSTTSSSPPKNPASSSTPHTASSSSRTSSPQKSPSLPYGTAVPTRPSSGTAVSSSQHSSTTTSATAQVTPSGGSTSSVPVKPSANTPEPSQNITTTDNQKNTNGSGGNSEASSRTVSGPNQFQWTQTPKDLPEVESSEISLPEVIASNDRDNSNNFVAGIVAWSCILVGVVIILFVLFSPTKNKGEISLSASSNNRRKKRKSKHLLSNKYYKD